MKKTILLLTHDFHNVTEEERILCQIPKERAEKLQRTRKAKILSVQDFCADFNDCRVKPTALILEIVEFIS